MRLDLYSHGYEAPSHVRVTLSKRNLLALLSKLDRPESACTLVKDEEDGVRLEVVAEADEDHYADRPEGPPGPMIDYTEQDIVRLEREGYVNSPPN